MIPYIQTTGTNIIGCNADLVICDGSTPILISLIDIAILNKKICADLIKNETLYLKDRENISFHQYLSSHINYSNNKSKYRFKSEKNNDLTHTIIYNTEIDNYIINWNNEDKIKLTVKWLRNKKYIPITEEILQKIIDYADEQNKKYTYSQSHIYTNCNIYTNNTLYTSLECYKVNVNLINQYLQYINLNQDINDNFDWDSIETIEDYIFTFLNPIKNKLKNNIKVLYNKNNIHSSIFEGEKQLFQGQIPVTQSAIEVLLKEKFVFIAGEQGFGKTVVTPKIINTYYKIKNKKNPIIFLSCPAITLTQWEEELLKCISDKIDIIIIKKTDDFIKWYRKTNMKVNNPTFILCGKETFKLQYKLKSGIISKKRKLKVKRIDDWYAKRYSKSNMPDYAYKETFKSLDICMCPKCGLPLKNESHKKEDYYFTSEDFTGNPKKSNYKCSKCNEILWQATYDKTKKTSVIDFIKRKRIKFDCVVFDEIQESSNSGSIIGNATRTLIRNHAKKVILLSGTPSNGYASSLQNILVALIPNTLIENNVFEEKDFIKKYGTLQAVTTKNDDKRYYYNRGRAEIKDSDFVEIEGINPLVFTKFLSKNFIIADLSDLEKELPPFNEYYVPIRQLKTIEYGQNDLFDGIKKVNPFNSKMYVDSIIKHYINNPFSWDGIYIECGEKSNTVYPKCIKNIILPKERELLKIVNKELKENRKCWIYTDFNYGGQYMNDENIPDRLVRILKKRGYKVLQLSTSVKTYDRVEYINKNKDKYDIFISNPKLVNVGINLQWCPNYITFMPKYECNIVSQAIKRGMRANSVLENRVYHLYYKNTFENEIIKRYQRKIAESNAILGKFNITLEDDDSIRTSSKFAKKIDENIK